MSADVEIRTLGEPGDLGWVILAHGEIYSREFGWDTSFEGLVARIVADYAADHDPRSRGCLDRRGQRSTSRMCVLRGQRRTDGPVAHPAWSTPPHAAWVWGADWSTAA